jgi:hypothetical protein
MAIAEAIYLLCAGTSLTAAVLLLRRYLTSRSSLLFWSVVGFAGLAMNNVLVFIDLVLVPQNDLGFARTLAAAAGISALLFGLIWGESRT